MSITLTSTSFASIYNVDTRSLPPSGPITLFKLQEVNSPNQRSLPYQQNPPGTPNSSMVLRRENYNEAARIVRFYLPGTSHRGLLHQRTRLSSLHYTKLLFLNRKEPPKNTRHDAGRAGRPCAHPVAPSLQCVLVACIAQLRRSSPDKSRSTHPDIGTVYKERRRE